MPEPNPLLGLRKRVVEAPSNLAARCESWVLTKICLDHIDGIAICDGSVANDSRDSFLAFTRQALALVKAVDPRRHRRISRQLDYIVNMEMISGGSYSRRIKVCHVDYSRLVSSDPLWNLRQLAQILVHEATHGFLYERGILYNKENRERIERLCRLEEYRFAQRFELGYAEVGVPPFNADWYAKFWDGKSRGADQLKRTWHALKALKKPKEIREGAAIRSVPTDAKGYNNLGEAYQDEGNEAKALAYFNHAIQLDPEFALAYNNRGRTHHNEARYEDAIMDYDRAIQIDSNFSKAYVNRGLTYRVRGEYDKAISDYDCAIALNPQFTTAFNNRGYAYLCQRHYDRAVADFDQALQLDPCYATACKNRALTYRTLGNYEKAMADYSRLLELVPGSATAYNNLAWLLATNPDPTLRDGTKARENATKACELSHWKNASAINTLALACATMADYENAAKWQQKYLENLKLTPEEIAGAQQRLSHYRANCPSKRSE